MERHQLEQIDSDEHGGKCNPPRRLCFIAPRHPDGGNWPWLTQIGPMRRYHFTAIYIQNTLRGLPKATRFHIRWQYLRAMRAMRDSELAFSFSTDISMGITEFPANWVRGPKRIYVGFTQDGAWSPKKMARLGRALRRFDGITVFSEDERQVYIDRYQLDPARVHLIPIHTDETKNYRQYVRKPPIEGAYVLSMGSPNRRFMPIAKACHALGIPLAIITRPGHANDSLDELARLGATIITNADKMAALTFLKHARFTAMAFQSPELPGAFTTLIHAMFLRTPCIVTSCLGIDDYVIDGETGLVVPHGDDEALGAAIERAWNDPDLVARLTECGQERAEARFSMEAAANSFASLTERVLNSP